MKSKMKKLVSLVLAMAMVLTMCIGMSATQVEAATGCDITIKGAAKGSSYTAYKLLDVTIDANSTNYSYTVNSTYSAVLSSALTSVGTSETDVVAYLDSIRSDATAIRTFADAVYAAIKDAGTLGTMDTDYYTVTAGAGGAKIEGVDQGYYLIVETSAASSDDSVSLVMLDTAGLTGVEVTTKEDVPELTKKIKDINDSTEETTGDWQDSADYDINDSVPFQLTATLPSTLSSYAKYAITFHDTMEDGLTFESESVKVYVDGTEVYTSDYTVLVKGTSSAPKDDCTFEVVIADVNSLHKANSNTELITVTSNSEITVEYTAKLNEKAVIGNPGNWNTAYLQFSNNPYVDTDTSNTPNDTVVVLTYDLVINKVDNDSNALAGAEFTLEKYNKKSGEWKSVTLTADQAGTSFTATGLDDGVYRLTETKTPDGYNSIDPIYFIVAATHLETINEATEEPLTALTYTQATWDDKDNEATEVASGATATFTAVLKGEDGSTTTNIINKSGSVLPSTGGIGTTIFYIVGAILVLGAGVVLVTRRRTARQ